MNKVVFRYWIGTLASVVALAAAGPCAQAQDAGQPPTMPAQELPAGPEVLTVGKGLLGALFLRRRLQRI